MIAIFYSLLYPIASAFSVIALLGIEYIKVRFGVWADVLYGSTAFSVMMVIRGLDDIF